MREKGERETKVGRGAEWEHRARNGLVEVRMWKFCI